MKILLATDGKPAAHAALDLIGKIARRDTELTVLAVADFDAALEEGAAVYGHYSSEAATARAQRLVDEATSPLQEAGFAPSPRVVDGYPPLAILDQITQGAFDLTVLGSGTANWLDEILIGSVANKVLHASPTSVLIVHECREGDQGRALVATDGSRSASVSVQALADFADPQLTKVHVCSVVKPVRRIPNSSRRSGDAETRAEKIVQETTAKLSAAGFETTYAVSEGHPATQILRQAEAGDYDLVSVGSRGLHPVQSVLLGSVSDKLVRHARATLVGRSL
jgi:nucleotide-binding universal stress UspA family protein